MRCGHSLALKSSHLAGIWEGLAVFHVLQCGEIMCRGAFAAVTQLGLLSSEAEHCHFKHLR